MNTLLKKVVSITAVIALLIIPYLTFLQGVDFTDKGLMLSYSMQMFRYPNAYHSYSAIWLTGAIGHAWLAFFPIKGMLGLNILFVFLLQLNALAFFLILKKYYKSFILLPAICMAVFFSLSIIQNGFGYQCLTVVILNIAVLLLFKGLTEKVHSFIFISSLLLGGSIFARLPNILSFVFFFFLIGYHVASTGKIDKGLLKKGAWFIAGFISGFLLIALIIHSCGYAEHFREGIHETQHRLGETESAYNQNTLLSSYIGDAFHSLIISLKYLMFVSVLVYFLSFFQTAFKGSFIIRKLHWILPVSGVAIALIINRTYDINYIMKYHIKYILPGISVIIGFLLVLMQQEHKKEKIFLLIAGIVIYAISFAGSNTGMNPYGSVFLILFVAAEMLSAIVNEIARSLFIKWFARNLSLLLVSIFLPLAIALNYKFIYRDDNNRAELQYSIHNSSLQGLHTSKPRADAVNGLLDVLAGKVHAGDELWATPNLPLLYALTETKPYLNHPWENLLLPGEVRGMINNAEADGLKLPVIIKAKGSTRNNYWPEKVIPENDKNSIERANLLNDFISRHHYSVTWQNNFFEVWLSK